MSEPRTIKTPAGPRDLPIVKVFYNKAGWREEKFVVIPAESLTDAMRYVEKFLGGLPPKDRDYGARVTGAQEAHDW